MKRFFGVGAGADVLLIGGILLTPMAVRAESPLKVVYPPSEHETIAEKIFFIGTASPSEPVLINGKEIVNRSAAGHFAPSLPLKWGKNTFVIRQDERRVRLEITRVSSSPQAPENLTFAANSLTPAVDIARQPNEAVCVSAIAPLNAKVSAQIGRSKILLMPQVESVELPANSAVLTSEATFLEPINSGQYRGCTVLKNPRNYGKPIFTLEQNGQTTKVQGQGRISILSPKDIQVVEVIADAGVARTGASTNHSRLTPLPRGTRARVTAKEGEWLRLDYGAWIKAEETRYISGNIPPQSTIRGATARQKSATTEMVFPLQFPVPVEIEQKEDNITLTLHNTTAQTDTIRLDPDPIIKRLDWRQASPTQIDYTFELHHRQQWGYELRYEGTNLIFALRHPPQGYLTAENGDLPLKDIDILLDPGHGGAEKGAKGPTGYPEKQVNLIVAQLVADKLTDLGAAVHLTRTEDKDVSLKARMAAIDKIKPDLAVSIHYNALPDSGDAENTKGISTFWYNTQAHAPAVFLHNYLITELGREDAGVFWNNLALTRPHTAPAILLELGFMINPQEFEWIIDRDEQEKLAQTLAEGIKSWFVEGLIDQEKD
ncbi:MAG: N-acetylmuramoyl-L-alanine amidase [Cyanobacteria bacterium J06623_7]